ncbi:MAG: anaerobic ribonucleoside-triphosphate reductase activating protein [Spirochaetales bacterium]|nr:anaerobic ribonucleoside-triphosphate reductase activating protein [Spirochaetales bacterium]
MLIGGFVPFSLIDYPPHTSCVVFTQGCNFRCPYCHNPELIAMGSGQRFLLKPFFDFLSERRGKLDAVVVTGGEPTLQEDLEEFVRRIAELGFAVKLDTNGSNPEVLRRLLKGGLVRAVAMDVKAPLERYAEATGGEGDGTTIEAVSRSIRLLLRSKVEYEFRTTVVKELLAPADVLAVGRLLKGAECYTLQRFVPAKTHDPRYADATSFSDAEFEELKTELSNRGIRKVVVR